MRDAALKYAQVGWKVVALKEKGKTPLSSETSYKKATSDLTIISEWWSLVPRANIGIQPGASGLIILDIDGKNGGYESLQTLIDKHGPLETRSVRTGSKNGTHYYFKLPPDNAPIKNKLSILPGVDVICAVNHVVAPPSVHSSGGLYEWVDETTPILEAPSWLLHMVREQHQFVDKENHAQLLPGPGALSKSTLKFLKDGAPDGEWNATLYKAAKDAQQNLFTKEDFIERAGQITGHLDDVDLATITSAFKEPPKHSPRINPKSGLKELILKCFLIKDVANPSVDTLVDLSNGKVHDVHVKTIQETLYREEWASFKSKRSVNARYTYNPRLEAPLSVDEDGLYVYNTYSPPAWRREAFYSGAPLLPVSELPKIYDQFLTHLVDGDKESKEYVLDWMAESLRGRNFTVLTAIGAQGVGKGTLAEILKQLHGDSNFSESSDEIFKSKFNGKLENKTLVYVDEVDLKTKDSHDRLKAVVNDYVELEKKGIDATTIKNYGNFYLSSNSMDAIRIEAGDRRYSIFQVTKTKLFDTDLLKLREDWLNPVNIDTLARYLLFRPINRNMLIPFRSDRYQEVKESGLYDWEYYVIKDWAPENPGESLTLSQMQSKIREEFDNYKHVPGRRKFMELQEKYPDIIQLHRPDRARAKYEIRSLCKVNPSSSPSNPVKLLLPQIK